MKNIVLTGYMASGKTTVGEELKKITGKELVDTDKLIEEEAGMTVNEIFQRFGEEYFRDLEKIAVCIASSYSGIIVSTGGGAVLNEENRKRLRDTGVVFNLTMTDDLIRERIDMAKDTRPLMADDVENIIKRYHDRENFYNDCDFKINTVGKTPTDIAAEILKNYILKTMILKEDK
ncbi:MAG: shikimate kinase [Clostridia bacterium]|nr:shikimate kinase [Clostridia bacterium]